MKLVLLTALIAVCGAAKLDQSYLPPASAATAGGTSASLQTPILKSSEGLSTPDLPTGSYSNSFEGVVVDAAAPGTRASSDSIQSGLGGPRNTYGSTNSKVGDAAFRESVTTFRNPQTYDSSNSNGLASSNGQNFLANSPERVSPSKDHESNIITYANDVSLDNYSYGFESDNGIAVGENGVANNGIQAQGGYSYKGDDGQVYMVTYTADEAGYRPQGSHLPTPPPIPKEILVSLQQNAEEEAAGIVDDGSYDAQKYNTEGDYTHLSGSNTQYNGENSSQTKRPESNVAASGAFFNQNSLAFGKPSVGQFGNIGTQSSSFNAQSTQFSGSELGFSSNQNTLAGSQHKESSQTLNGSQEVSLNGIQTTGYSKPTAGQISNFDPGQNAFGSFSSQTSTQNNLQGLSGQSKPQDSKTQPSQIQFGSQNFQYGSQTSQFGATQLGAQPTKPTFAQTSSTPALNANQESFGQTFNQEQHSFSVHKPVNTGLAKNQQPYKPLIGPITSNKPSTNYGQTSNSAIASTSSHNGIPNVPSRFGNDYLPPFTADNKPTFGKPETSQIGVAQGNQIQGSLNTASVSGQIQSNPQISSASAIASSEQPGLVSQQGTPQNSFQTQTSSKPNRFSSINTSNQGAHDSKPAKSFTQNSVSNFNAATNIFASSQFKPTAIPDTELTTPLEPGEKPAFSQTLFNSQTAANIGQPLNNDQSYLGNSISPLSGQTFSPSAVSNNPQQFPQNSVSPTPTVYPAGKPGSFSNQKPQYSQNQNIQYQQNNINYSTQKPSFSQGSDDSYYYNQPSKPFDAPEVRPQGSRFPSAPSYQSTEIPASQNNQFFSQQGTLPAKFPNTLASTTPTTTSQFTQTQGSFSNDYNSNSITQAAISSFPSVPSTNTAQYGSTQIFGKPTTPQQQSSFQTFPSKPLSTFQQKPTTLTQSQVQPGQSSSTLNRPTNSQSSDIGIQTTSTQQYEGTIYQYNKPAQTIPAPAQTDSTSSQSVQTDFSSKPQLQPSKLEQPINGQKPQTGSQQLQFVQNAFGSQSQQTGQTTKPQIGTQTYKPFGSPSSNQFGQNTQTSFGQTLFQQTSHANNIPSPNPAGSTTINSSHNYQTNQLGNVGSVQNSGSQYGYRPVKPTNNSSPQTSFGQYNQHVQGSSTGQFNPSQQAQEVKSHANGQNTQGNFNQNTHLAEGAFGKQPLESSNTQVGLASQFQGSFSSGLSPNQQNAQGFQFNAQAFKPFGNSGSTTASKPLIGTQTTQTQFTQTSQQSFDTTQLSSQPTSTPLTGVYPTKPDISPSTVDGSLSSPKPGFSTGLTSENKPVSSFEQFFQNSQYGSSASKPQFGQNVPSTQINSPNKFEQASTQASVGTSQTSQSFKPFGSSSGSSFSTPGISQSTQTFTTGSGSYESSGSSQVPKDKPQFGFQPACCKTTPDSLSKPNQNLGQVQNQFGGFQGIQSFSSQSVAGKGEEFGGPREPPRFDAQTGYHY